MTSTDELTKILLIEDDDKLAILTQDYLNQKGFSVSHASDGYTGLTLAEELAPDLIIIDLMLPNMDGLTVCRNLQSWYRGPLVILTASDEDMDQVAALEMGADDFISKPVHPRVLLARVRMLLRRYTPEQKTIISNEKLDEISFGSFNINLSRRQVILDGVEVKLTESEFELLWLLAKHPEQTLSRNTISQHLRGIEHDGLARLIDNKIVSLRKKLKDNTGSPRRIITVRGKGYLFISDKW